MWEYEEEDELVIEKAELERWESRLSKAGFGSTEHGNLLAAAGRSNGGRGAPRLY